MASHDNCAACKGHGYFRCVACVCNVCGGNGRGKCDKCENGRVPCIACGATGWVETKGWIFTNTEPCPSCRRGRTVACRVCKASGVASCRSCNGGGRNKHCSKCGGTQRIDCHTCDGSGKVVSEWFKSLNGLSVERLNSERDKRKREVVNLRAQIRHVEAQIRQLQREWNDAYNATTNIHSFDAGGYQSGQQAYYDEIGDAGARIRELESETAAIEQALNSK